MEAPRASLVVRKGFLEEETEGLIHKESPGGSQMCVEGSGFRDKICCRWKGEQMAGGMLRV